MMTLLRTLKTQVALILCISLLVVISGCQANPKNISSGTKIADMQTMSTVSQQKDNNETQLLQNRIIDVDWSDESEARKFIYLTTRESGRLPRSIGRYVGNRHPNKRIQVLVTIRNRENRQYTSDRLVTLEPLQELHITGGHPNWYLRIVKARFR